LTSIFQEVNLVSFSSPFQTNNINGSFTLQALISTPWLLHSKPAHQPNCGELAPVQLWPGQLQGVGGVTDAATTTGKPALAKAARKAQGSLQTEVLAKQDT